VRGATPKTDVLKLGIDSMSSATYSEQLVSRLSYLQHLLGLGWVSHVKVVDATVERHGEKVITAPQCADLLVLYCVREREGAALQHYNPSAPSHNAPLDRYSTEHTFPPRPRRCSRSWPSYHQMRSAPWCCRGSMTRCRSSPCESCPWTRAA